MHGRLACPRSRYAGFGCLACQRGGHFSQSVSDGGTGNRCTAQVGTSSTDVGAVHRADDIRKRLEKHPLEEWGFYALASLKLCRAYDSLSLGTGTTRQSHCSHHATPEMPGDCWLVKKSESRSSSDL